MRNKRPNKLLRLALRVFAWPVLLWAAAFAAPEGPPRAENPTEVPFRAVDVEWGGQVTLRGILSFPSHESVFESVGTGAYEDGSAEGRLKNKLYFGDWGTFETHYEAVLSGGTTRRKQNELEGLFPALHDEGAFPAPIPEDDRRVMDLTAVIDQGSGYILYHRVDRLVLTLKPRWGAVSVGRQAVTWGNGLLFNPMDLFNPFSPTDIEREYKIGDDLLSVQITGKGGEEFHLLAVPRRDPCTGNLAWDQSSLAGRVHLFGDTTEVDLMAAKHYEDKVAGLGATGYLGGAAWRFDLVWTLLGKSAGRNDVFSMVANLDYSWVWWGKNFYGFIEAYWNGLGRDDYGEALLDRNVVERLDRGELFVLGRFYLAGHIRVEIHPLFNAYLTVINNMEDPSGIIQPRGVWDMGENTRLTAGCNLFYGSRGTEFGGFGIPGTPLQNEAVDDLFLWLSYYF